MIEVKHFWWVIFLIFGQSVDKSTSKLFRHVIDGRLLDTQGSLEIIKGDNLRNTNKSPYKFKTEQIY